MEYADEENVGMVEVLQAISSVVLPKFPKLASSDGQVSKVLALSSSNISLKRYSMRRSGLCDYHPPSAFLVNLATLTSTVLSKAQCKKKKTLKMILSKSERLELLRECMQ
jgi:hypothetical protein